jgi:hypothetical protein
MAVGNQAGSGERVKVIEIPSRFDQMGVIWVVVAAAWECQWYRKHHGPCCWILIL